MKKGKKSSGMTIVPSADSDSISVKKKEKSEPVDARSIIEAKYGKGAIFALGEKSSLEIASVSTGFCDLDSALGIGGFPCGRIVEIYGQESSGKTTLALRVAAEVQKRKEKNKVGFIDVEHALDPTWAKKQGVRIKELMISQPDYGEQALDIALIMIESNEFGLVIIDSVAALVPKAELEGEMTDQQIGLQARMMSKALRKLTSMVAKTGTLLIFINQVRDKINMTGFGGDPTTTSGGRALKFYASIRLSLKYIGQEKGVKDKPLGSRIIVHVKKNKVASPFKKALITIFYDGYDKALDICYTAFEIGGVFDKAGVWYSWGDIRLGQGKLAVVDFIQNQADTKMKKAVESKLKDILKERSL